MEENIQNQNLTDKNNPKNWIADLINSIKPKINLLDSKFESLIPNPKLRKVLYIFVGGMFGLMFLLVLVGLILSPVTKNGNSNLFVLNKPQIIVPSPTPLVNMRDDQKRLLKLRNEIRNLKFPESILTIPTIESDLKI